MTWLYSAASVSAPSSASMTQNSPNGLITYLVKDPFTLDTFTMCMASKISNMYVLYVNEIYFMHQMFLCM